MADDLRAFLAEMGIDDPDELLARYLSNPTEVAEQLEAQALRMLLGIGTNAAKADDIPKAQAALSRALAIDEGNERALKLLGSLGQRRRRLAIGFAITGAVILVLGTVGYATWRRNVAPATEVGIREASSEGEIEVPPEDAVNDRSAEEGAAQVSNGRSTESKAASGTDGRRWVVFKPTPSNVSISVDGGPPRAYGPDFQRIRVKVGKHTFRFVGAEDCCEERLIRRRITAGSRDFELAVKLRYKAARLYLRGPAPADVSVQITLSGNRTVSGRIREILRIPMSAPDASAQVKIEAPGYVTYKSVVHLRAGGDLTEHSFALERRAETP